MPSALLSIQMLEGWFEDIETFVAFRQPVMFVLTDLQGKKPILIISVITYGNLW